MNRLRWAALALAGLVALAAAGVALRLALVPSPRRMHFSVADETVAIPTDPQAIARGRHLSESVAVCTACHGENLGGRLAFAHPLLGRGYTPNLTSGRGGIGRTYRVEDWVRAIRHGVNREGRGLLFMPVDHYAHLRDADLGAMIAYYRQLPPVDNEQVSLELSWVARTMIDLGLSGPVVRAATMDPAAPRPAPPAGEGAYLVRIAGCTFCHGANLAGGRGLEPGAPRAPDLTAGSAVAKRSRDAFFAALRGGVTAEGHPIDPKFMPWTSYRRMTDDEIDAIWRFLKSTP